ncbi:MAG TPA: hypothetical protein ENJ31_00570, partial [Anaerolineae bacterium]|nr:hypothetical protein [Anaerolineae bacterium]
ALVEEGTITAGSGRAVLEEIFAHGGSPAEIVRARGLAQISDAEALSRIVAEVVAAHPEQAARYRGGKASLLQWFVGQVMRATRGKANPQLVQSLLREALDAAG